MRTPVRPRVVITSIVLAAASLLTIVISVLADSTAGPLPK
jgi:hypothetical protein